MATLDVIEYGMTLGPMALALLGWALLEIVRTRRGEWDPTRVSVVVVGLTIAAYLGCIALDQVGLVIMPPLVFRLERGVMALSSVGLIPIYRAVWRGARARWWGDDDPLELAPADMLAGLSQAFPLVIADRRGVIRSTTTTLNAFTGHAPGALRGQPLTVLMPDRFHGAHRAGLARYLRTREPVLIGRRTPVVVRRADGTDVEADLVLGTREYNGQPWFIGGLFEREQKPP